MHSNKKRTETRNGVSKTNILEGVASRLRTPSQKHLLRDKKGKKAIFLFYIIIIGIITQGCRISVKIEQKVRIEYKKEIPLNNKNKKL